MNADNKRKEFEDTGLARSQLGDCPIEEFRKWFQAAKEDVPGRWFEPDAISLATSDAQGRASVRVVLLKGITDDGFQFFTNYKSKKGKQLADNPWAAFTAHWPYQGRQIRVEGPVEKTSREVSRQYFYTRHRGSQLSASISHQSEVIDDRQGLVVRRDELEAQLDGAMVPLPDFWGGYLVRPLSIEFWQGRDSRLHDRIVFCRGELGDPWQISRLSP